VSLSIEQRLAILAAIPTTINDESVLVFEDDGGGWHHAPTIESWISFAILPGPRYLYNIRSKLSENWNDDHSRILDERGQLNQGTLNIYVCSVNKRTVQTYERFLAEKIERERLNLSLDFEGVTTGPEPAHARPLGSYNDFRLKKKVYRTLIEAPILYKFVEIEVGYPIKVIELEPWIDTAAMEHLKLRAPLVLRADMLLAGTSTLSLAASIVLVE